MRNDQSNDYPWLFRRPGTTKRAVELIFVGDVMLGRQLAGDDHVLKNAATWLASADLAIGNLEGVIGKPDHHQLCNPSDLSQEPYRLDAPPEAVRFLQNAGFDILSLANNHALDRGEIGLEETVKRLNTAGIRTIGAGIGSSAYSPLIIQSREIRIAFLAYNLVPSPAVIDMDMPARSGWQVAEWDLETAISQVMTSSQLADAVIVYLHWGEEYAPNANPMQQEIAAALTDAGADLVIGSHPHVVQGISAGYWYGINHTGRFRLSAFSLGNFSFDQYFEGTRDGLALKVFIDQRGLQSVQALPLFVGARPRLKPASQAMLPAVRLQKIGFECDRNECFQIVPPESQMGGLFESGKIDLTGNGQPEEIFLNSGRLTIRQAGLVVWRSPSEWYILDASLGDPNDDGRYEIFIAAQQENNTGVTSHPYVLGYRSGLYRLVWGGSAVADPIREVELGDLDGDGADEVIVLEQAEPKELSAFTVWRWHGWGFELDWRSPAARYYNLTIVPAGGKNVIVVNTAQ